MSQTKENNTNANLTAPIIWLLSCCGLIALMVMIGAITRLTESGLSMVEWRPLIGALPPLNEAEWQRVFALYQQTPEFQKVNFWMDISDFKSIFFWEWAHRLLGRLIGMVYALPLIWFWVKGHIPKGYKPHMIGLLLLGAAQGYMGWFMVKSGLVDQPSVSHYRLAAHLSLAFLLFCLLLKTALNWIDIKNETSRIEISAKLKPHAWACLLSVILTIFWGAYTAGMDAGLIYNETFPLMGGKLIPDEMHLYSPFFVNMFETAGGVQFTHRLLATIAVITLTSFWVRAINTKEKLPWPVHALGTMILIQYSLGIATLLSKVAIPLATAHQMGALITLALLIITLHHFKKA